MEFNEKSAQLIFGEG